MTDRLARKLSHFVRLSQDTLDTIHAFSTETVRSVGPREDILREGEKPTHVTLMIEGWAYRYKVLADGRRQITSFFLPGDLCDLNVFILRQMDHSIATITSAKYARVTRDFFEKAQVDDTQLTRALWWENLVTNAIQREWTVNLGRRNAIECIAHLFCELYYRLRAVGLVDGYKCELPFTQSDLSDATGMTSVHVNRTVQELRSRGIITWRGRNFEIHDFPTLQLIGMFNPNYLHLYNEEQSAG